MTGTDGTRQETKDPAKAEDPKALPRFKLEFGEVYPTDDPYEIEELNYRRNPGAWRCGCGGK